MDQLSSPSAQEWISWLTRFSIPAVILVGIVLFLTGARSGKYEFKCILAPAIGLCGILIVWIGFELEDKFPKAHLLHNAISGCFLLLLAVALFCSLLGLNEYRKLPRHSSTRRGARFAIVTGVICILSFSLFLLSAYTKRVYNTRNFIRAFTQERLIRIIDLGFQMYQPKPWIQVNGSRLSPTPCVAFTRINPSISFSLVVQKPSPQTPNTIQDLIQLAQAQAQAANTTAHFSEPSISSNNGIATALFESQVAKGSFSYFYVYHLILYRGYAYQLITWGPSNDPNSVRAGSELMGSRFSLLAR